MITEAIIKHVESLYTGSCNVWELAEKTDGNSITEHTEELKYSGVACRLSYGASPAASSGLIAGISQSVKLLLSPAYAIRAGSRIEVTQAGVTQLYRSSGAPAVYLGHQEISLELWSGEA